MCAWEHTGMSTSVVFSPWGERLCVRFRDLSSENIFMPLHAQFVTSWFISSSVYLFFFCCQVCNMQVKEWKSLCECRRWNEKSHWYLQVEDLVKGSLLGAVGATCLLLSAHPARHGGEAASRNYRLNLEQDRRGEKKRERERWRGDRKEITHRMTGRWGQGKMGTKRAEEEESLEEKRRVWWWGKGGRDKATFFKIKYSLHILWLNPTRLQVARATQEWLKLSQLNF